MCNYSQRERAALNVKQKTVSLWSFINSSTDMYKNPLYWASSQNQMILIPNASMRHLRLWKAYYCRWNPSMRTQVHIYDKILKNYSLFGKAMNFFKNCHCFVFLGSNTPQNKRVNFTERTIRETSTRLPTRAANESCQKYEQFFQAFHPALILSLLYIL